MATPVMRHRGWVCGVPQMEPKDALIFFMLTSFVCF